MGTGEMSRSCNDFRRECEREFNAKMTYAGKSGVTLKGEPWQTFEPPPEQLSEFWTRVYDMGDNHGNSQETV